jgi:hypothetical protein
MPVGVQAEGGEDVPLDEFEGLGLHCTALFQSCFDFIAVAPSIVSMAAGRGLGGCANGRL